jgi:hypothetical protein
MEKAQDVRLQAQKNDLHDCALQGGAVVWDQLCPESPEEYLAAAHCRDPQEYLAMNSLHGGSCQLIDPLHFQSHMNGHTADYEIVSRSSLRLYVKIRGFPVIRSFARQIPHTHMIQVPYTGDKHTDEMNVWHAVREIISLKKH